MSPGLRTKPASPPPLVCPNRNRTFVVSAANLIAPDFAQFQVNPAPRVDGRFLRREQIKAIPARSSEGMISMAKELRTAEQLSDMIVSALGVGAVEISVRKDHAYGWQPIVVSSPGDLIGYQRRVEEIAKRFRLQFELRD
jgi:hypothetical protein